ncbi:LuxR C-terminal-related transcriptional regulator [Streptomyces sp. NBC_01498]|uniref:helix-turn-helix transcriptional regulator n=1 Tax=Streptomyces sp. NBC_01498 TaxID=2975870 RepID=UPI002E7B2C9B|nr:AAA family ATPase [Streptomyces sp. NBC_01498]WTL27367.1 LuxR C-terminal-related transcriptional regulator [Streptomyces sp. NBC_01498]
MTPTTTVRSPLRLYGRAGELALLEAPVARLRAGRGGTLVLTGAPGLGRTALLRHIIDGYAHEGHVPGHAQDRDDRPALGSHAFDGLVHDGLVHDGLVHDGRARHRYPRDDRPAAPVLLHATAAPAERLLPYSGLHTLLCSAPDPLPLPTGTPRPDTAAIALLDLLTTLGAQRPLLICVDDAHAWDAASRAALAFALRRLAPARRVTALLTTAEQHPGERDFTGLPTLRLGPLDHSASRALLDRLTGGRADPGVREELLREATGNPRLLTALAGRLTEDQLAGRGRLPQPLPGGESLLDSYAAHLDGLPDDTRLLLLFAAAAEEHEPEGTGADTAVLLRAGALAGIDPGRLAPAETLGAVRVDGDRVHFTQPLLRRAVMRRAPLARRRAVHRLLATVLDGPHRTLPRLVQRACAAGGHDPALAEALESAAAPPRPHADRAAALARAAALSTDEALRGERFAAAAEHAWLAGDPGRARALLTRVRTEPAPGRAHYVRGLIALRDGPAADAAEALLTAAGLLAPHDGARAVGALLGAAEAAWVTGDVPGYLRAMNRITPPRPDTGGERDAPALDRFRAGMCAVLAGRTADGRALLRACLDTDDRSDDREGDHSASRSDDRTDDRTGDRAGDPAALLRSGIAALVLGEVEAACRAGARALAAVRAHGPEALLPRVLEHLAYGELRAGRHARARAHAYEGLRAADRLGQRNAAAALHAVLALAASVEGDAAACAEHAAATAADAGAHGLWQADTLATWAVGRADLAAGRHTRAAARLAPLVLDGPLSGHFAARMLAVPCFVEAAVLAGRGDEARGAVEEFTAWTAWTADPQAPAQLARCRALLAPPGEAAARYEEALAHHARASGDFERARTQLLYGQWLRRRRRTREARDPLRDALVAFERCGARAWAERAGGELRAAGESVAGAGPVDLLTAQQRRVARCVAEGATNREVAVRLSVSPRTVDHHLRNVFALLGVRSRTELARLLDRDEENAANP